MPGMTPEPAEQPAEPPGGVRPGPDSDDPAVSTMAWGDSADVGAGVRSPGHPDTPVEAVARTLRVVADSVNRREGDVLTEAVAGSLGDRFVPDAVPAVDVDVVGLEFDVDSGAAETHPPPAGDGIDPSEKTPRSFHLSRHILERARAAAYWLSRLEGVQEATNVSELVERALHQEVRRLEEQYNAGAPFPAVLGRMRTGPGAAGAERIRRAQRARRRSTDT